jgi:hypothetical protein
LITFLSSKGPLTGANSALCGRKDASGTASWLL